MKLSIVKLNCILFVVLLISGCASTSDEMIKVKNVAWYPEKIVNIDSLLAKDVPDKFTRLVFYRAMDDDDSMTGANISINDDYQVSLHPGNFTIVYSCVGDNRISSNVTEKKTNDLLLNHRVYDLKGNETYYFEVDVDDGNRRSKVTQVSRENAVPNLTNMAYQSHQISKVIPHCIPRPIVVVNTNPPVVEEKPPVLEEKLSINLQVLFDNDKSIIKPQYFSEIDKAAELMQKYSDTTIVIEGHTDSNASHQYNQRLSERRANAIKQLFINRYDIDRNRIQAIGYGESRPIATNATEEGRQLNRRVVAVIDQK